MTMTKENIDKVKNISAGVVTTTLLGSNPIIAAIGLATVEILKKTDTAMQSGNIDEIKSVVAKEQMKMKIQEAMAKVSQELAIAKRIETSAIVTIQEFYDNSGEGNLGLKTKGKGEGIDVGLSGSGRHISQRIYTFKGWQGEIIERDDEVIQEIVQENQIKVPEI